MDNPLQESSIGEIRECFGELEALLDNHLTWVNRLQESFIFRSPADPADVAGDAHRHCQFGHWFYGAPNPLLRRLPEFAAVGRLHEEMHRQARALLLKVQAGQSLDRAEYAILMDRLTELRRLVAAVERRLKDALSTCSRLTSRVFENASECVIITDSDGLILDVNAAFTQVTGYARDEVLGKNPEILKSGRHDGLFYRNLWESLHENGHWRGEIWNRRKNGEIYPEWLSIHVVKDESGAVSHYVGIFSDITVTKQNEARLHHLAHYDPLTNLPNRALFRERLRHDIALATRDRRSVAVMFLDLDRFKIINDTLGHSAGDTLLTEAATRLTGCVRQSDTVARLGGDEFTVILYDVDNVRDLSHVANKILEAMDQPFTLHGHEVFVTASIGISIYPDHGTDAEALIKAADVAMYRAKERGRNRFEFQRTDGDHHVHRLFGLERNLRKALQREELILYYQPQIDLDTGRVTGVEALLRWRHPEHGLISPTEFIPLAEETGLIVPIGDWVLRRACLQMKAWQDQGVAPFRVSVNVSARQFKDQDLAVKVAGALEESGLDARWLTLELTESSIMHNLDNAIGTLHALRAMGVSISIDDFGSGYSSLSYLKHLPVDVLKIDKSFIQGVADDPGDQTISKAIIALGKAFGLRVVAEGAETHTQMLFLREHQCHNVQGYYFSRPLPPEDLLRLLARQPHLIDPD